jgi:hypothetical protein
MLGFLYVSVNFGAKQSLGFTKLESLNRLGQSKKSYASHFCC